MRILGNRCQIEMDSLALSDHGWMEKPQETRKSRRNLRRKKPVGMFESTVEQNDIDTNGD
jgi:hypothetical protein